MATPYDWRFTQLTLEEKVRVEKFAESLGLTILPIAQDVAGIEPTPIPVIPASKIPRSDFSHMDDRGFEALQGYYASAETRLSYPPLGYAPSVRSEEKEAAALIRFMAAVAKKPSSALNLDGYPVAQIAPSENQSIFSRLTSIFR